MGGGQIVKKKRERKKKNVNLNKQEIGKTIAVSKKLL